MKRAIVILWSVVMAANAWTASEVVDGVTWYYETFSSGGKTLFKAPSGGFKPKILARAVIDPRFQALDLCGGYLPKVSSFR